VNPRRSAAEFDLDAALHEVGDEIFVWIARGDVPIPVVSFVMQCHVAGIGVEYGDNLGPCSPIGNIIRDQLHVEYGSGQISLEGQGGDTEHNPDGRHLDRNINLERFS
jgi:hypothetical protein